MKLIITGTILLCSVGLAFGQSPDAAPKFEISDVHASPKSNMQFFRAPTVRGGVYELRYASMVDMIRTAFDFDADKVLGGPNWLEMDRFDVRAKLPPDSTPDSQRLMLQGLLKDRFKLESHTESRPLPAYFLTAGKNPKLKKADGTESAGCHPQSGGSMAPGSMRLTMMSGDGPGPTTLTLGPGFTIQFECRNMTMQAFAMGLRSMMGVGATLGTGKITDETGLEGAWNFDVRWSMGLIGPMMDSGEHVSVSDALEKQLGLKLEERKVPTPVIVVDRVNETPTPNLPAVAEALPVPTAPTEFDVASVKPAPPDTHMRSMGMRPGGRLNVQGMPLRFLIQRAFNSNSSDEIVGLPSWADTDLFDITAKAAADAAPGGSLDMEAMAPMIRSLLAQRFGMKYHTEERELPAYSLVAGKPRMKKADPASRTHCVNSNAPPGSPPGTQIITCQNITMAQFADRLRNTAPELTQDIEDATGLEGGWDFTVAYSRMASFQMGMAGGRGAPGAAVAGEQPGGDIPTASEPNGALTIFEAVEKELGLKLEKRKRSLPVFVIDHIERTPTEN